MTTKPVNELSINAQIKAFNEFVSFTEDTEHEGGHTFKQFVDVSRVNGWKYESDGKFIG